MSPLPPLPLTILIVICLGVCLFGFILFGTFWASWIWISAFFPILGKCSSTFSSFNFSGSFSVYSPSRSPIMWILLHLMQSQMSHHIKILFSFFCSVWVSYIFFCLPAHRCILLPHPFCFWTLLMYFSVQL